MPLTDESIARAHAALTRDGFEALALGTADEVSWFEHELASLAEHRLGDRTDPRRLPATTRERWVEAALSERAYLPSERTYERCYWIAERGERVGTVALSTTSLGGRSVALASFYVLPEARGRGLGASVLRRIGAHLAAEGLGIQLDTSWCWNRAVRFYVRFGMWVRMWKRELSFRWSAEQLAPHVVFAGDEAELSVRLDGAVVPLVRARRGDGAVHNARS